MLDVMFGKEARAVARLFLGMMAPVEPAESVPLKGNVPASSSFRSPPRAISIDGSLNSDLLASDLARHSPQDIRPINAGSTVAVKTKLTSLAISR
ncbi:hypothetical protein G6L08_34465 [Agrobacterium rhizogenes]|nr:hypothetical protein [Rhizobium rhizogenes]NTG32247.1 hypothetical protein [Rhizobium rhizogenes]